MKRLTGIACMGLLAIGLIAGCGSSDDDGLSKEEFLTKANAICAQGNKEIDAAGEEAFSSGDPTQQEAEDFATETVIPNVEGQIDQIKALDAPSDDQDQVDAILASAQTTVDKVKANPTLLATDGEDPFAATNKLAKDYGMAACADDS